MKNSAALLADFDRCRRCAYHGQNWELNRIPPNQILQQAVESALSAETEDPGQWAGDEVMQLCADRGLRTAHLNLFDLGLHFAALGDLLTTLLRGSGGPWERPEDIQLGNTLWQSSAFLNGLGTRLVKVILIDRWSPERESSERHSWRVLGECAAYQMPMQVLVCNLGQTRDGRHVGPLTKGWLHPRSHQLRLKKRDGQGFDKNWTPVWRENRSEMSRDRWIDAMREDDVLSACVFPLEVDVPESNVGRQMRELAERNLESLAQMKQAPEMSISQCFFPTPCAFTAHCWEGIQISEREGYVPLT